MEQVERFFLMHLRELAINYSEPLGFERDFLRRPSVRALQRIESSFTARPGVARCIGSHSMVTGYYSNAYFGVRQSIAIDSLIFALDEARGAGDVSGATRDWGLVALLACATHLTNSPGHFAQFFRASPENIQALARLRARDVWAQWSIELNNLRPAGTRKWRRDNEVICDDTLRLLEDASTSSGGVAFADPPYTASQYSRFYHLLDSLILYDYPACEFQGRYRRDRYKSPFCSKSHVFAAFQTLIANTAGKGRSLYLTYPENGLLIEAGASIADVAASLNMVAERLDRVKLMHAAPGRNQGHRRAIAEELWRIDA